MQAPVDENGVGAVLSTQPQTLHEVLFSATQIDDCFDL